jgi:hypothetical protein
MFSLTLFSPTVLQANLKLADRLTNSELNQLEFKYERSSFGTVSLMDCFSAFPYLTRQEARF